MRLHHDPADPRDVNDKGQSLAATSGGDVTEYVKAVMAEPEWDQLAQCFEPAYGRERTRLGNLPGGPIDGDTVFDGADHREVVSYGLAKRPDASGRRYELSMKLPLRSPFMWPSEVFEAVARRYLQALTLPTVLDYGKPLRSTGSELCAVLLVPDTVLPVATTSAGPIHIVQLIGITRPELDAVTGRTISAADLQSTIAQTNALLLTNLKHRGNRLP